MTYSQRLSCLILTAITLQSGIALAQGGPVATPKQTTTESDVSLEELQRQLNAEDIPAEQRRLFRLIQDRRAKEIDDDTAQRLTKKWYLIPEEPTGEDYRKFVISCRDFTSEKGFNKFELFGDIPAKFLDSVLLEAYDDESPFQRYWEYRNDTFADMQPARAGIVSRLKEQPDIIQAITFYGWVEDVRKEVIIKINRDTPNVSFAWFEAAVELNEPKLFPKLHEITVQSKNQDEMIRLLATLPDYDLNFTLLACWEAALKDKYSFSRRPDLALNAAKAGSRTALAYLMTKLSQVSLYPIQNQYRSTNSIRLDVLTIIDFRGNSQDILNWYKTNKDNLTFDSLTKRFIVADTF